MASHHAVQSNEEKGSENGINDIDARSLPGDPDADPKDVKRILRKIDYAVVPYSALLYLLSFLDRVNIGQARVAGLLPALKMTNDEYQIALTVFFVSYVAVELPSNLALKYIRPRPWITGNMIAWSLCMIFMGFVQTPGQLMAVRFLLGLFEGGLFPGLNFVFSLWYTREELGKRVALFFAGATLAGAFGGLLAFGIRQMDGVGGRGAWSWIFILEGLLTLVCALPGYWLVTDFPDKSKTLDQGNDRQIWMHHLHVSQGVTSAPLPFNWDHVWRALKDWRTYIYATLYISIAMPFYCVSLFLPSIIAALGFTNAAANALSAPPFALGFLTTLGFCWLSDKTRRRGIWLILVMTITIIGYIILIAQNNSAVSYFAIFLTVAGVSPGIALAITFVGSNWGPVTTRAAVMGIFFSAGNSAGIISSNVYPASTAPRYFQGHSLALAFAALAILCTAILMIDHGRENRRRDQLYGPAAPGLNPLHASPEQLSKWGLEGKSQEEILSLGSLHPGYRYML